jgi:hypothetical protein
MDSAFYDVFSIAPFTLHLTSGRAGWILRGSLVPRRMNIDLCSADTCAIILNIFNAFPVILETTMQPMILICLG